MALDPQRLFSVGEARRFARRRLPGVVFDYVDGAAGDEVTVRANRQAFHDLALRQATPRSADRPSIATTVLGTPVSSPVLLGPCGLVSLIHPGGAVLSARAAAAQGTISVLSTVAGTPLEAVAAAAPGPKWFQVYAPGGVDEASSLAERARSAGYEGLMITVDTAVLGKRERDLAHGITMPPKASPRLAAHLLSQGWPGRAGPWRPSATSWPAARAAAAPVRAARGPTSTPSTPGSSSRPWPRHRSRGPTSPCSGTAGRATWW